jgi:hypothetical protein
VGCGTSRVAQAIYRKRGWNEIAMPRFILLCRSRSVVQKYLGDAFGPRAVAKLIDGALAGQRMLLRPYVRRQTRGLIVEEVDSAPSRLDPLLVRRTERVVSHRSAAWINWLLGAVDPAHRENQRLFLVSTSGREPVGYFLIRRQFHAVTGSYGFPNVCLGSLKDWCVLDPAATDTVRIMLLALRELMGWGVDAAEICVRSDDEGRALRRLGLARLGDLHLVFSAPPGNPLEDARLHRSERWWVTAAEGDNFYN